MPNFNTSLSLSGGDSTDDATPLKTGQNPGNIISLSFVKLSGGAIPFYIQKSDGSTPKRNEVVGQGMPIPSLGAEARLEGSENVQLNPLQIWLALDASSGSEAIVRVCG